MYAVYIFGSIMAVLVASVIFAPMIESRWRRGKDGDSPSDRKEAAIAALQELEFEYQTGKVSDGDYAILRARYAREALAARDELGETVEGRSCPACGAGVAPDAKFCSACGGSIT